MTKKTLNEWWLLRQQVVNGWHMEPSDKREFIRLNFEVMEACHKIHNDSMSNMRGNINN
jgi:hypothetical protein